MISLAVIRWTILEVASCCHGEWDDPVIFPYHSSLINVSLTQKTSPGSKLESSLATSNTFRKLGNSQFAGSDSRTLPLSPLGPCRFQVHQSVQH